MQLSKSAVFTEVGQCRSSLVDLFVQFRDCFADLFDLKPVVLYFRLILIDSVGAILKPFAALISDIPEIPVIKDYLRIEFGLRSLMLSIKKIDRSLAFYYLRIQVLLMINLNVGKKALYQYLQLTRQRCHFLLHGFNASLKGLLFSDFTAKVSFL